MNNRVKKCVGKEGFERMNYLYQISNAALKNQNLPASTLYSQLMVNVSKKTVQRMEPEVKRTVCKRCNTFLQPGMTCKVRVKRKFLNVTCLVCATQKRFKLDKNYELWCEKPEAVVETLDYNTQKS